MRKSLAALAVVGALSCRRPLGLRQDAGGDSGAPSVGDSGRLDASAGDLAADGARDFAVDDFDRDLGWDLTPDASFDAGGDAVATVCPADVQPLDVCGCGCCGGVPGQRACYYPSLGESRDTIPNPSPPPTTCATAGCSFGVHYLCCPDPGVPQTPNAIFCGNNTSGEDLPLFAFTKRDAETCTTIEIGLTAGQLPLVSTPFGVGIANAWRGPCDDSSRTGAVGGLGSVTLRPARAGDSGNHYNVHVALFFDDGSGIADVSRIDVDDIAVRLCAAAPCAACGGACAFDTTYRYGLVGGDVPYRDTVALMPPASYQHIHLLTATSTSTLCAPPPPACGGPAIDVADITAVFGDADVQDAFTRSLGAGTTPFYGQDQRPVDGPAFQIARGSGGGFLIGAPCPAGSTPSSCMEIPGGLSRLESLLLTFDQQQLADPSCASLRP